MSLGNTLGDDTDGLDLRVGKNVEGGSVDGSGRREVDDDIDIGVLLDGLTDRSVDREQSLLGAPVELLDVVTAEGVDHRSDRRGLSTGRKVKVEHTLDGSRLETEDKRSSLLIERSEPRSRSVAFRLESDNVAALLLDAVVGSGSSAVNGSTVGTVGTLLLGGSGGDGGKLSGSSRGGLCDTKSHWDDSGDRRLGTVDLHWDTDRLSTKSHSLETLLVIWSSSSDPDGDVVSLKTLLELLQGSDDTLESSSDVGEVGSSTTNDEDLAFGVRLASNNQVDDRLGVLVGLSLGRSTRVLSVVGKLMGESSSGNGVRVDDGSTTTSDHGPDSTGRVEHGKLERSTSRRVELLNVGLLLGQISTERSGPDHGWSSVSLDGGTGDGGGDVSSDSPFGSTKEVGSLIELGGHVEIVDLARLAVDRVENDEGVDLEVGDCE